MSTAAFVILGFILFCLGLFGVLARRNFIVFSGLWHNFTGQVFTVFLIAVAAGEAAIGLGLLIALYRLKHSANIDDAQELKG